MNSISASQIERSSVAAAGCVLLLILALGWAAFLVFSVDEPSFLALFFGIPVFLLTPVVSATLFVLLRRAKHNSMTHRVAFYGSAGFFAAWSLIVIVGVLSK
ncbi:MAG: hypothetical protein PHY43_09645 [Verrucomicrobiales bacterium]|nr:hypothetical protein [Verrucomicrobiales bacterium]